jgi:hypothetical protein
MSARQAASTAGPESGAGSRDAVCVILDERGAVQWRPMSGVASVLGGVADLQFLRQSAGSKRQINKALLNRFSTNWRRIFRLGRSAEMVHTED